MHYLALHPRATDTAAGICERWLREEGLVEDVGVVEAVLDQMVDDGLVRLIELPGGVRAYGAPDPSPDGSGE